MFRTFLSLALFVYAAAQMGLMKENNVFVCACPKCGSTSLFDWIYIHKFGHPYYNKTERHLPPWPQTISEGNTRWQGTFTIPHSQSDWRNIFDDPTMTSMAIIRDPVDRLHSAWKSKCKCPRTSDEGEWQTMELLTTAGIPEEKMPEGKCLSFPYFIELLFTMHMQKKAHLLNQHWRPQTMLCFNTTPPERWDFISTAANVGDLLPKIFNTSSPFLHMHQSHGKNSFSREELSAETVQQIKFVTRDEYESFGYALSGLLPVG